MDDGPAHAGVGHQLPDTSDARGGRAKCPQRSGHHDPAVLVDPQRVSVRHHAAAPLRLCDGQRRTEARVCHLRDRLVLRQHGARPREQLAGALRPARAAGICRRIGESGRDEGDVRMVSRRRTRARRRLLQHGRVAGLDARGAARRVGDPDAQLAVRVRAHRRDRTRLGRALAGVLSISRRSTRRSHRRNATTSSRARSATSPGKANPRSGPFLASGTSGASPSRGSLPIRRGAR